MKTGEMGKCAICDQPCNEYASDGECVHEDCDDACGAGAPPIEVTEEESK